MLYCNAVDSVQLTVNDADLQAYLMYQLSSRLPHEMIAERIVGYIKYLVWAETQKKMLHGNVDAVSWHIDDTNPGGDNGRTNPA